MELVIAFVSALLGLSVAFFLSISFYDLLPASWLRFGRRSATVDAPGRRPLLPRTIHHTSLD
jgi:hypothetical protein